MLFVIFLRLMILIPIKPILTIYDTLFAPLDQVAAAC